ncbi:alpha/beta fold hydrolase [Ahrensia sp. R2A130]|uniref:alpha/beta fold hydrolase n=1 Tax=Ahrensia sp. R2A130 TaxID=744979 RepID=UPI0001E0D168|nr:alpha/beta fold hydrolase [Ahrensia sp. R2A130]EFL87705.1 poly(3-hydroxyalkanoate) polymerase 1 [Ahrensia sp. R2A130]
MPDKKSAEDAAARKGRQERVKADIAEDASESTLALNPIMGGLPPADAFKAWNKMALAMTTRPDVVARQWLDFAADFTNIIAGTSETAPEKKDRRFADPAWQKSPMNKALMQSYLSWQKAVANTVDNLALSDRDAARARLVSQIFTDAVAPSNNIWTNPTALKTLIDTGGQSAIEGMKHFFEDMTKNGGLPSSVDASKFKVGENIATSPGTVVFRNEVLELIHYTATTDKVYERPFVLVPPQINKYYSVDLSDEKSIVKFLTSQGIQVWCVSWRNPTPAQRDWTLATYIEALDEAVEAAMEITGTKSVNMMGSCSGGITLSAYAAWIAAQDRSDKIEALILAVCVLNTQAESDSDFGALVTPETVMVAKQASATLGVLDGQEMAKMFAWMRPNDLIWNYWVNNYLLGNKPPAFDVLYWNADTTRLPAGLHADFLDLIFTNPFMNPGTLSLNGKSIDMTKVKHPTMVVAGTTDHITPWTAVYETARIFGEDTEFILSNSGHLQSLLNPPGNPKAWYVKGKAKAESPDAWVDTAEKHEGSWWTDWAPFLHKHSGKQVAPPKNPGSKNNPPLGPAPGTYIFD